MSYYYDYLDLVYGSAYDRVVEAEIVASRIRRSRVEEEIQIQERLRRSRIQAEIQAERAATQNFIMRSRLQQQLAEECMQKEQQLSAEMALTESVLSRSRRQKIVEESERELERSRQESQRLSRSAIQEQTLDMTGIVRPETDREDGNTRRRAVEEDVSRILTTY